MGTMVHGLGEGEWCTWCRERNAWGKTWILISWMSGNVVIEGDLMGLQEGWGTMGSYKTGE